MRRRGCQDLQFVQVWDGQIKEGPLLGRALEEPYEPYCLVPGIDDFAHLEDGQEHTNDDAANHDAQEHNQDRFDQGGEAGKDGLDFVVEEVGNAFEHAVDFAGL